MRVFASPDASPALQETIAGDLYDGETGEINNEAGIAQAQAVTKNLNQIVKDSGATASTAKITGSGDLQFSAGTPGLADVVAGIKVIAGAKTAAGFERYSRQVSEQSLHYGVDRRLQEKAKEVATIDGKFYPKIAADYLHKGRQEMQDMTDARAKGQTEFSFGTTSVIAPLLKGAVQDSNNLRDQIFNMGREENDNGEFFQGLEGKSQEEIDKAMAERFGNYNSDQYMNLN